MTRREIGFLLIGLGTGLGFAVAALIELLLFTDFYPKVGWALVFIPILLIVTGIIKAVDEPKTSN